MVIRQELSNDQDPHNYDPTVDIQLAPTQPYSLFSSTTSTKRKVPYKM